MRTTPLLLTAFATLALSGPGTHAAAPDLPPVPVNLPGWMTNRQTNHVYRLRAAHNDAVYAIAPLARDLNAVAVGHAMAYEDLVTGKADRLETDTYARIGRVLKNPPRWMPDEARLSPTFVRKYGVLEQVFDWAHVLHAQTIDVLAAPNLSDAQKDAEIERLWRFYSTKVPYAITGLPMNMAYLDSQSYSGAFRKTYPKVNGLFWGYHWLQSATYDMLYRLTAAQQRASYSVVGERYHQAELSNTTRPFMPMFADTSPVFAARFPQLANAFDNLHMLHDLANDILATEGLTEKQKDEQITRAIWLVMAAAHSNEKAGDVRGGETSLHDHRYPAGMPGMGMMKGATTQIMYMPAMDAWMRMNDCHHCSMPLVASAEQDDKTPFQPASVSADGWTMRVRCALCARDMSAETKGRALLRLPTEDPTRTVVLVSDEEGTLSVAGDPLPDLVFLEDEGSHAACDAWSQAFTSRAAFAAYVAKHPQYKDAKPLTLDEWQARQGKKPDTYVKPVGPVANPYANDAATDEAKASGRQ